MIHMSAREFIRTIKKADQAGKHVAVKYASKSTAERIARGALAGGKEGAKFGATLLLRTLISLLARR
jgi:hypothetical protein